MGCGFLIVHSLPNILQFLILLRKQGYPGKYYCPRMNSMNKPTYAAICTHSPTKPVLIFVSSRRQTRLTALDLIQVRCNIMSWIGMILFLLEFIWILGCCLLFVTKFAASDEHPRQFLDITEEALQMVLPQVTDQNLRHTLQFGIGLHHAGLTDKDRSLVEELFANNKIQALLKHLNGLIFVLICPQYIWTIDACNTNCRFWYVQARLHGV